MPKNDTKKYFPPEWGLRKDILVGHSSSANHRPLSSTHPDLLKLFQHLNRSCAHSSAVRGQYLCKKLLSVWVGTQEGALEDIEIDALVLGNALLETQPEVYHCKSRGLTIFLYQQVRGSNVTMDQVAFVELGHSAANQSGNFRQLLRITLSNPLVHSFSGGFTIELLHDEEMLFLVRKVEGGTWNSDQESVAFGEF